MIKLGDAGFDHMQAMIEEFGHGSRELADEAAEMAAQHILDEASKTVPLDTGFLREQGAVSYVTHGHYEVDYHVEYAEIQHENEQFRHAPGRRAKWLELTLEEQRTAVREIVRDHLGRFGRGTFRGRVSNFYGRSRHVGREVRFGPR